MNVGVVFFAVSLAFSLGLLALAIVLKVRVWGGRGRVVRSPARPNGAVAVGARMLGFASTAVAAQLADWHMRGVVEVTAVQPTVAEDLEAGLSGGPRWQFRLGDRAGLGAEETGILDAIFDPAAQPGAVVVLEQDDQAGRGALDAAIVDAVEARNSSTRVRARAGLAVLVRIFAVAGFLATFISSVFALTAAGAAGMFFGALVVMVATLALVARPLRPLPEARAFAAQLHGIRRFVHTAASDEVTPGLVGWAMIWNLPGEWSDIAPPEVTELRWRERCFPRVDSLDYPFVVV